MLTRIDEIKLKATNPEEKKITNIDLAEKHCYRKIKRRAKRC